VLQDFTDDITLVDKADYFHLAAALGTGQRINLPDLLYALTPLGRWYFFRPVIGYINYFNTGWNS